MKLEEYVPLAIRTEKPLSARERMQHSCMGLITEVGEVTTELKRMAIYEKPLDGGRKEHIAEEIGDVMWYLAIMLNVLDADLQAELDKGVKIGNGYSDCKYQTLALHFGEHVGKICGTTHHIVTEGELWGGWRFDILRSIFAIIAGLEVLAENCSTTLSACMDENIAKLRIRYPATYSNEAAEGRADKAGLDARVS